MTHLMRRNTDQQQHRRDQFRALGASNGTVVFLGDSITEGGLWNEWFPHVPVLNRGIGGETSADLLARLDTAIYSPSAVFLLIGTNDLGMAIAEDDILANIEKSLDTITAQAPDAPIFLQSVIPREPRLRTEVVSLNRRLERLAATMSPRVTFVDLWPTFADECGDLRPQYTLDRLHLNGDGYLAWVCLLRPLVARIRPIGGATTQHSTEEP
jgi:lysophospholipase L1-like esterase